MPSTTEKQRRFMSAEFERLREGLKTRTGMRQLEDFARKPSRGDKPERHTERRSHITAATLLMRRLRFGSEWL